MHTQAHRQTHRGFERRLRRKAVSPTIWILIVIVIAIIVAVALLMSFGGGWTRLAKIMNVSQAKPTSQQCNPVEIESICKATGCDWDGTRTTTPKCYIA